MLGQRLRRWPNIETTLGQRTVFAGTGVSAQLDLEDLSSTCIIMIMSTVLILLSTLMVRGGQPHRSVLLLDF